MVFIDTPNLPEKQVSFAVVDGRLSIEAEHSLGLLGIKILRTCRHTGVYEAISFHPDIMIHHTGDDRIVYAPETDPGFLATLSEYGFSLIMGESRLARHYPADIPYNAARVGRFYFHNLKYTDPVLKRELERQGIEPVNVKQGYSKCSISIVNESSIITSDAGIAKAAEKKGLDVLLIASWQDILLPGLDNGFIGGSSGLVGPGKWAVNGDAEKLSSFNEIREFLSLKHVEIIPLTGGQPVDIGSILPLACDPV